MKATEIINKVKEVIGIELSDEQKEIKLAQAELENGTIVESEEFKEGSEIFIVTEDEKVALPVGEYKLIDGEALIIEEEGIIKSIGEAVEEEVEAEEEDKKEEMAYATKEELEEVKKVVEEIKAILEPKEEEMSDDSTSVKSEEIIKKVVYSSKEEMSEVEKVNHNPEPEAKPNLNLHGQNRTKNTLDRVMARIANK
jgi:hypothetical protein|tara:strand:- start:4242 stop:4832 length:591 start_codon:yes stop_codon:yes gene_type:complete